MKVLTILNLKGGVGKTTTTINLAEHIAMVEKKRVLLIDADPQANLTHFYDVQIGDHSPFFEIFALRNPVKPFIIKKNLHIIPSNVRSSKVNTLIDGEKDALYILKDMLCNREYTEIYDYCIIDCPPSLGHSVVNSIVAANHVIIPITAGDFAFQGLEAIISSINTVRRAYNPDTSILGILPTLFHVGRKASETLLTQLAQHDLPVFSSRVRFCECFRRAELAHQSVYECDKKSNAAIDMTNFSKEVLERIKHK